MPLPRIPILTPETMTPEQRAVHDAVVTGPRGALVGPLLAALHRPSLADQWQKFGAILRYETSLPPRLTELAIIVTARHWNAQTEWLIHARAAAAAGLPGAIIDAIGAGERPDFAEFADPINDPDDEQVYDFARYLVATGRVPGALHAAIGDRWGTVGVVELTAVIGYYTMVAMTLNAHELPLPDDAAPPLDLPPTAGAAEAAAPGGRVAGLAVPFEQGG